MKRSTKITLGILSFWPFFFIVLFIVSMFATIGMSGPGEPDGAFMVLMFIGYGITLLSVYGMMIYYIINVFMNDKLPSGKKALWAAVLFLGNMLVIPFYWYFYIWCEPKPAEQAAAPLTDRDGQAIIFCASCGTKHTFNTYACTNCGIPLHSTTPQTGGSTMNYESVGTLIPYKNTYALLGYYVAVFSMIPGIGAILGPAAIILGAYGLKDVKANRGDKGTVHAWVAIVLGTLTTMGNIAGIILILTYM